MEEQDSDKNPGKVFEQYWLHARHQETQRLWFTNIYAVISAGVLAYHGQIQRGESWVLLFLILLSFLGYAITYSWNVPFTLFSRNDLTLGYLSSHVYYWAIPFVFLSEFINLEVD